MSFFDIITKHLFPVPILIFITGGLVIGISKLGLFRKWGEASKPAGAGGYYTSLLKRRGRHTTAAPFEPASAGAPVGGGEGFQNGAAALPTAGVGPAVVEKPTTGEIKEGFQTSCKPDTPDPERYLGPYRAGGANVPGTNFNDVQNPLGRKFDETPLDRFYDEYEQSELDAEVAAREKAAGDTIQVQEDEGGEDMGALFSSTDLDITNIPWDAELRDMLPSDVLWGFVSTEASKGLFLKAYSQLALSLPDAVQDLRPGDDASPPAFNMPDLPTSVDDPAAQILNDTGLGVLSAVGQRFNPLDAEKIKNMNMKLAAIYDGDTSKMPKRITKTNSQMFDDMSGKMKKLNTKLQKISKSTLKKGGPIRKLRHMFKKIMAKITSKIVAKLQKFMATKLVKSIIMRVASGAILASNIAATAASLGTASPALAAWIFVMGLLETMLSVIDVISMAASTLLPVILEKYLDGEGICPGDSKQIQEIISDPVAYFFFTTFVPLGDLVDLFGPYICWDGAEPKVKIRVSEPSYLEDKTLSLSYKKWPPIMETSGQIIEEGRKLQSDEIWDCGDGFCRQRCQGETYSPSRNDTTCYQKTQPASVGTTQFYSCADMKSRKGATAATGLNMTWRLESGTGDCFEPYEQGGSGACRTEESSVYNFDTGAFTRVVCDGAGAKGCGCVRATRLERAYCDAGFTLDQNDLRCYSCPAGYTRIGVQCFGPTATYTRTFQEMGSSSVKRDGYMLPSLLAGISDPNATDRRNGTTFKLFTPYCNFASPVMLDRMAQFYYEQSYANPDIIEIDFEKLGDTPENRKLVDLSGGPMLVQWDYISRFYGVIASSELSCDVACEIRTITYNPITGASFKEEVGCSNIGDDPNAVTTFDRANTMCYRRFYFIKGSADPQGIFTVTGCTNSDGTAPDAEVNSWDEGVTYVPSLPKIFLQRICPTPVTWSANDFGRLATSVGSAALMAGMGQAEMLLGPAVQYGTGKLDERLQTDKQEDSGSYLEKDAQGIFRVTTKTTSVTTNNEQAHLVIDHGPVVEQASGVAPLVNRCRTALVTDVMCSHKYNVRDVIRQYEMDNPTKRVKQIDIIEPRGIAGGPNHGCYYRWKEVDYDPETNIENTNFANKEVVFKYRIQNQKTCVYEPERIIYDVRDADYPLRTSMLEGSTTYLTRKKVTKPVRFIRIDGGGEALQLSQIVVYNTDYINVARGRTPTSRTSPALNDAVATFATDGNAMARMYPTIYHSTGLNPVFEIDLGREEFIHSITIYNRSHPIPAPPAPEADIERERANQLTLARRWNGRQLRCLDAARAENYSFALVGDINGQPQLVQTFNDFPALELQRRRPFNSFAVPRGLPAETTLGGVEVKAVRYIRIDGGADFLQLSQVAVFNINNVNVARGKMPNTNTTAALNNGLEYSASYATDGAMEARSDPRFYHSSSGNAVFEIDLGREELLNRIVVYNRRGADPNNRADLLLLARRWNGYKVRCLDAARTERYSFGLQGTTGTGAAEQPNFEQTLTFSPCPTKCSDKAQVERLVKEFNDANTNARILKVLKAWTPKPNRCDFEVEMMRIGTGGQKTFAKETVFMIVSRDGNTCSFKRDSDGAASINSGTYIQPTTPDLVFGQPGGFGASKGVSIHEAVTASVKSVFGTMTQTLQAKKPLETLKTEAVKTEKETRAVLSYVAANQTLKGCPAKCSDPSIMGTIADRYNSERGTLKQQFGAERSTMKRILRSVGGTDTECDVLFEEEYELYDDALYPPIEKTVSTKAVRVRMADAGGCKWSVAPGTEAIRDVSGAAVGLLSGAGEAGTQPFVAAACAVDCRSAANLAAVKAAATAAAGSTANQSINFRQVTQSFRNGSTVCEYKVAKDVTVRDPYTKRSSTESDIDTYLSATFKLGTGAACSYTLDSVQEFSPDELETAIDRVSGEEAYFRGSARIQPPMLFSYDPETAVSSLVNATPVNM